MLAILFGLSMDYPMICVFLAFIFLGQRTIGEFGIGLPTAVALDAFILRTVLVPALMHLFGDANWWLPGWLAKALPHLSVDPPDALASLGEPGSTPPHDLTPDRRMIVMGDRREADEPAATHGRTLDREA
jgi:hypothetical protein